MGDQISCQSLGYDGGALECDQDCAPDTTGCCYDAFQVLFAYNMGGPELQFNGITYASDAQLLTQGYVTGGGQGQSARTDSNPATNIFSTERYAIASLNFPVNAGLAYRVRFHLTELYIGITKAGDRLFDIVVEGTVAFPRVDPFSMSGLRRDIPVTLEYDFLATDGTLNIELRPIAQSPALVAIEVLELSPCDGRAPPPVIAPAPSPGTPALTTSMCSQNPACVAIGLTGNSDCCPTPDGVQLACCSAT